MVSGRLGIEARLAPAATERGPVTAREGTETSTLRSLAGRARTATSSVAPTRPLNTTRVTAVNPEPTTRTLAPTLAATGVGHRLTHVTRWI